MRERIGKVFRLQKYDYSAVGTGVFDETNPNLSGIFLFGHYLESYFEKEAKTWMTQKHTWQI